MIPTDLFDASKNNMTKIIYIFGAASETKVTRYWSRNCSYEYSAEMLLNSGNGLYLQLRIIPLIKIVHGAIGVPDYDNWAS